MELRIGVRAAAGLRAALLILAGAAAGDAGAAIDVRIEGLAPELERNVRAFLSIAEAADEPSERAGSREPESDDDEDPSDARVRRLHELARTEIAAALEPFGYYEPSVEATLERHGDDWEARYVVDPGPPTVLRVVEIDIVGEGADSPAVAAARSAIRLEPGQQLNHPRYEAAKQALFDAAYNAGFIDVTYRRSELLVNRGRREAEVHLLLDTGPRYFFGEITIRQDILAESFIDRFVRIDYGDPFDTDRLLALQMALNDSGYFNEVIVDVERESAVNRHIPVVVHTSPRRTQEYTVGLGYGTDTGPRIRLGIELRRLNPYGHSFTSDLRLSNIEQAVAAEYRIPRGRDLVTDFLALRGSLGAQDIGDWDTLQQSIGASWHDAWRQYQRRLYITGQREEFSAEGEPTSIESVIYAGWQLTRKSADDPILPRRGYSWSVDMRGGSDALGSGTSFGRLHVSGNVVRSLGERVRVLLRGEYGAIRADEFARLPPSQRFYAGGDGSVRGYGYQDLGPQNAAGARIGGRYLLVASAELEVNIVGNYGAAVFFDAGNADDTAWPDLMRGVGIGARWRSPVGVVGIDLAHPLDDPDTDVRLHLSVGSDL